MTDQKDEEPVAYLGGEAAPGEDDPGAPTVAMDSGVAGAAAPPEAEGTNAPGAPAGEDGSGAADLTASTAEGAVDGYLGGETIAEPPPAGAEPEAEVDGYLGGEAGAATTADAALPALPPAEGETAGALPAAEGEEFREASTIPEGEVGAAPEGATAPAEEFDPGAPTMDQVEQPPVAPDQDASYFDQYGADTAAGYDQPTGGQTTTDQPRTDTGDFGGDLPKTITQQDAENIIKRITTKKILPPEAEKEGPRVVPQELTPQTQPGLKVFPIVLVLLLLAYGGCLVFRDQLVAATPKEWQSIVAAILWTAVPEEKPIATPTPTGPTPLERARAEFIKKFTTSEELGHGLPLGGSRTQNPPPATSPTPSPSSKKEGK